MAPSRKVWQSDWNSYQDSRDGGAAAQLSGTAYIYLSDGITSPYPLFIAKDVGCPCFPLSFPPFHPSLPLFLLSLSLGPFSDLSRIDTDILCFSSWYHLRIVTFAHAPCLSIRRLYRSDCPLPSLSLCLCLCPSLCVSLSVFLSPHQKCILSKLAWPAINWLTPSIAIFGLRSDSTKRSYTRLKTTSRSGTVHKFIWKLPVISPFKNSVSEYLQNIQTYSVSFPPNNDSWFFLTNQIYLLQTITTFFYH